MSCCYSRLCGQVPGRIPLCGDQPRYPRALAGGQPRARHQPHSEELHHWVDERGLGEGDVGWVCVVSVCLCLLLCLLVCIHVCTFLFLFLFSKGVEAVIKYNFFYFCVCLFLVGYLFIYGSFFFWCAISVNFHVCICMLGPRRSPVGGGPRERFVLCT